MVRLLISTAFTLVAGLITFSEVSLSGTWGLVLTSVLIILGFILLIKGGDYLVTGGSSIANLYDIPPIVVGLTILAFGTSAPELFVNLIAAVRGETDLLLANVIGSNMSNLLLIGGIASIIFTLKVKDHTLFAEIPFSLFAVLLLLVLVNDVQIDGLTMNVLSKADGLILLMVFTIFLYYIFSLIKSGVPGQLDDREHHDLWKALWMLVLGVAGLYIGGELIVVNAVDMAEIFGVSKLLIGSTILAIGTSIPELVTSVIAAVKKQADMAVGNIIGSNVFNIFWIAGLSSVVKTIPVDSSLNTDIFMLITATLFFFTGIYSHKEQSLTRFHGVVFVCLYAGYLGFLFWRG